MARGRMLNKTISIDQAVNDLTDKEALIFTWLIPHLNKNGCFYADEKVIKSLVFPLKTSIPPGKIKVALQKFCEKSLIVFYKSQGNFYICFLHFDKNQPGLRKDKEGDCGIPEPENGDLLPQNDGRITENIGKVDGKKAIEVKVVSSNSLKGEEEVVSSKGEPSAGSPIFQGHCPNCDLLEEVTECPDNELRLCTSCKKMGYFEWVMVT